MKTNKLNLTLSIIIASALLISCSKDDDGSGSNGGDEYLTASIEGTSWSASTDYDTTTAKLVKTQTQTTLLVQGSDNNGSAISFSLPTYSGVGTYKTGDSYTNPNLLQYATIKPAFSSWSSNLATAATNIPPGTIIITAEDGKIVEGTFSFTGYSADKTTKNITEGKFKANIE